jgi:hypothetical protein
LIFSPLPSCSETTRVVLERLVRGDQGVAQLVALEDVVVLARLVARAVLRVDRAPDRPQRARSRSIQITIRSARPASSTPWTSRSAKRTEDGFLTLRC